jgi:hypothetical protein
MIFSDGAVEIRARTLKEGEEVKDEMALPK